MKKLAALAAAILLASPPPAHAVSAGAFLTEMNSEERIAFLNGAIDMFAFQLTNAKQGGKASCAIKWFFEGNGPRELVAVFENHKELPAVGILVKLIDRHCK